MQSIHSKLAVY